jgi:hypothetical protein
MAKKHPRSLMPSPTFADNSRVSVADRCSDDGTTSACPLLSSHGYPQNEHASGRGPLPRAAPHLFRPPFSPDALGLDLGDMGWNGERERPGCRTGSASPASSTRRSHGRASIRYAGALALMCRVPHRSSRSDSKPSASSSRWASTGSLAGGQSWPSAIPTAICRCCNGLRREPADMSLRIKVSDYRPMSVNSFTYGLPVAGYVYSRRRQKPAHETICSRG